MKLQLDRPEGLNTFTAYGDDYVSVNGVRYRCNLLVLPEHLMPDWSSATSATFSLADGAILAGLDAEIVLLGTGKQLRFPAPDLLQPLIAQRKGLEVMDVQAACRTYNILLGEGRKVAAALFLV